MERRESYYSLTNVCEMLFKKITCNFWKISHRNSWEKKSKGNSRYNNSEAVLQLAFQDSEQNQKALLLLALN